VLDIIGRDSPVLASLPVGESWDSSAAKTDENDESFGADRDVISSAQLFPLQPKEEDNQSAQSHIIRVTNAAQKSSNPASKLRPKPTEEEEIVKLRKRKLELEVDNLALKNRKLRLEIKELEGTVDTDDEIYY